MRVFLELFRIILILAVLGGLGWFILSQVYSNNLAAEDYQWLGAVGIYLILFVFYRNKLQFTGWYKGKGRTKLSMKVSLLMFIAAIVLIAAPFFL
ncbi:hypothetical protein CIL03_18300 [Virgibacillus indicus]|uniref:Uncharacterized protein n=1 Tax=Virgibacillus indicus TaxID=2024554 RepID=A0A265N5K2_9BACI|nr:hypothetical protein [Virgibacillus indicus]OZU87137.1 hypothetical protein CIL03_18300 [Virgibacillus indicus]